MIMITIIEGVVIIGAGGDLATLSYLVGLSLGKENRNTL